MNTELIRRMRDQLAALAGEDADQADQAAAAALVAEVDAVLDPGQDTDTQRCRHGVVPPHECRQCEEEESRPFGADNDLASFPASTVRRLWELKEHYRLICAQMPPGLGGGLPDSEIDRIAQPWLAPDGEANASDVRAIVRTVLAAHGPGAGGGKALAAHTEPVVPRKIAKRTMVELKHAVYAHHGWQRAAGESMSARIAAFYDVAADHQRGLFVATPKAIATRQVAYRVVREEDLGRLPDAGPDWVTGAPSRDYIEYIAQHPGWAIEYAYSDPVSRDRDEPPSEPRPSWMEGGEEAVAMAREDGLLSDVSGFPSKNNSDSAPVADEIYPRWGDGSIKSSLREEITTNHPIDYEGGENGDEPRYIITAGQLDWLDRIERVAQQTLRSAPTGAAQVSSDETLTAVYDTLEVGSLARDPSTLMVCLGNVIRRSRCLSAVERVLTVETAPDPDEGDDEPGEECLLRWGADPEGYAEHFKAALAEWQLRVASAESVQLAWRVLDRKTGQPRTDWIDGNGGDQAAEPPFSGGIIQRAYAAPIVAQAHQFGNSGDSPESLSITHRPLMRHAASLLRLRKPVPSDFEQVASELEQAADGQPKPADAPPQKWLDVAAMVEQDHFRDAMKMVQPVAEVQLHPHDASVVVLRPLVDFEPADVGKQLYLLPPGGAYPVKEN